MRYRDRLDAGQQLAEQLRLYADRPDVLVLTLPRGGVPVGFAVAQTLHAPLDAEVCDLLAQAAHRPVALSHTG